MSDKIVTEFTYTMSNGEKETVYPGHGAKTTVETYGIAHTPFLGSSGDPLTVIVPWHRIVEVFVRG